MIDLRKPCQCGYAQGRIARRGLNDCVFCAACSRYQYNASRVETGERRVSLSTTHKAIKPKMRARILERASARCEICGAKENLTVGHLLSVADAVRYGYADIANHDENLIAQCAECNIGQGSKTLPLRLAVAILRARIAWSEKDGAA